MDLAVRVVRIGQPRRNGDRTLSEVGAKETTATDDRFASDIACREQLVDELASKARFGLVADVVTSPLDQHRIGDLGQHRSRRGRTIRSETHHDPNRPPRPLNPYPRGGEFSVAQVKAFLAQANIPVRL